MVSIDSGSDDSSDVGFLRAYNSAGTLLGQVISNSIPTGGSQTLTISRPTADIAYIIAAGVGSDITPLDNLVFGRPGTDDAYSVNLTAGQSVNVVATLPGAGPFQFDNQLDTPSGSALELELLDPVGTVVASGSTGLSHTASVDGSYVIRAFTTMAQGEYFLDLQTSLIDGDFNDDGFYNCTDIDGLTAAIAAGTNDPGFDLTGDGSVNLDDLNAWLAEAGAVNNASGNPYLLGDADLNGNVDGTDFNVWNANAFTSVASWCSGDFNADGNVDGQDFGIWNVNKFTSALAITTAPNTPVMAERTVLETAHAELQKTELRSALLPSALPRQTYVESPLRHQERSQDENTDEVFGQPGSLVVDEGSPGRLAGWQPARVADAEWSVIYFGGRAFALRVSRPRRSSDHRSAAIRIAATCETVGPTFNAAAGSGDPPGARPDFTRVKDSKEAEFNHGGRSAERLCGRVIPDQVVPRTAGSLVGTRIALPGNPISGRRARAEKCPGSVGAGASTCRSGTARVRPPDFDVGVTARKGQTFGLGRRYQQSFRSVSELPQPRRRAGV